MQELFARMEAPFVGAIVSPFCPTNRTEASQMRYVVLDAAPHQEAERGGAGMGSVDTAPFKLAW